MGYFFYNIADLANFLISEPRSPIKSPKGLPSGTTTVDFESLLRGLSLGSGSGSIGDHSIYKNSVLSQTDSLGSDVPVLKQGDDNLDMLFSLAAPDDGDVSLINNIDSAEAAALNGKTVNVLLSRSNDRVTIQISSDLAGQLIDSGTLKESLSSGIISGSFAESIGTPTQAGNTSSRPGDYVISFAVSDLAGAAENKNGLIRIEIAGAGQPAKSEFVDIGEFISLLKKYPEPIKIEIPITSDQIDAPSLSGLAKTVDNLLNSSFAFDLRNIPDLSDRNPGATVSGMLTIAGRPFLSGKRILPGEENRKSYEMASSPKSDLSVGRVFIDEDGSIDSNYVGAKDARQILSTPLISHRINIDQGFADRLGRFSQQAFSGEKPNPENPQSAVSVLTDQTGYSENGLISREKTFVNNLGIPVQGTVARPMPKMINFDEIKSAILFASRRYPSTVRLRLQPAELGNIDIKLFMKEGVLNAEMKVGNVDAMRSLNSGLHELKTGLENQNLRINEISVILDHNLRSGSDQTQLDGRPAAAWNENQRDRSKLKFGSNSSKDGEKAISGKNSIQSSIHKGWIDLKA